MTNLDQKFKDCVGSQLTTVAWILPIVQFELTNIIITIENDIVAWASNGIEGSRGSTEKSRGTWN